MQIPNRKIYRTDGYWEFTEDRAIFHCITCGSTHQFELERITAAKVGAVVKCRNHIHETDWGRIMPACIYVEEDRLCIDCMDSRKQPVPGRPNTARKRDEETG